MNMIERGRRFVQRMREMGNRSVWEWCQCTHCGSTLTIKHGGYYRRPWTLTGRREVRIQRHLCKECGKTYSETMPWLVRGSWYAREVHRSAVDHWVYVGSSFRRIASVLRSWMGQQERWLLWQVMAREDESRERCYLSSSTVHRWVGGAGKKAQEGIQDQWEDVENSGQFGTDGLWARLRGGAKRVLLLLVDTATGVVWTIHVAAEETSAKAWEQLFRCAKRAGLSWRDLDSVVSDGAQGLLSFLRRLLGRVHHQRCVWHFWRGIAGDIAKVAAGAEEGTREQVRKDVKKLLHAVIDAASYQAAEEAMQRLSAYPGTAQLAQKVNEQLDRLLYHLLPGHEGLVRISPEWLWRDFRLRLSHGRNHGSHERLEQAGALWMVYHNFTPAQWRSERKRKYKHPGLSPLQVAGAAPGEISYLDALEV